MTSFAEQVIVRKLGFLRRYLADLGAYSPRPWSMAIESVFGPINGFSLRGSRAFGTLTPG
jgi:hypothetical protein